MIPPSLVITGLGTIGPGGCGRETAARALEQPRLPLSDLDTTDGFHPEGSRPQTLQVADQDLSKWLPPRKARRMSRPSRWAVVAARSALEDAGLPSDRSLGEEAAVILSTAFGTPRFTVDLLREVFRNGPQSASPFLFTETVANAPSAQVAIACGATGTNTAIAQREAGPLLAVAHGARELAAGRARVALVGAVDEIHPLLHAVYEQFGALASAGPEGPGVVRPFDRYRDGIAVANGATVLVLETEEGARRRGAPVLSRLLGWGGAFDPSASPYDWGTDTVGLGASLARLLARRGIGPEKVDRIVSGASGTPRGDRLEAEVLRQVWRSPPPVIAPKAHTGEYGGGFLAAAVLAAGGSPCGPTLGFREPDPALDLVPHDGRPLPAPELTLVSSLAAGGAAAWILLGAPGAL